MISSLQRRLETLYGLERRRDKLGLEGTRALLDALGQPERSFRSIHVAGTNGKGSVCALVERALREGGARTGLFTSPHLVDFRERIRVSGRWADEDWLEAALDRIEGLPEGRDRTFFEVSTALGFLDFAERGVEWAVVEVGLGGRLDSTNVLTPEVTVITSIGLDHTEILGTTLEAIAAEKAGIVKPGVPLVSAVTEPGPRAVIERIAAEQGAPLVPVTEPPPAAGGPAPVLRLNRTLALAVLREAGRRGAPVSPEATERGFAQARWPGRFERCPTHSDLWWDGAHNPGGATALAATCGHRFGVLILAVSRDKDASAMLDALESIVPEKRVVATRSRNERALDPARIAEVSRGLGWEATIAPDVPSACDRGRAWAAGEGALLTGSLFAVGEAMATFGGAPGEML